MALDGLTLANVVHELSDKLIDGRIDKIYQIEKDDLLISIRSNRTAYKLLLTANSNYPRLHLTDLIKNPQSEPPMFCMMLRKHLGGGRILKIEQPDCERIVVLSVEATNELGDKEIKKLVIEIMGRHSNIILLKEDATIIDSIKHISFDKSSVREILPGRTYTRPPSGEKINPLMVQKSDFINTIKTKNLPVFKTLYMSFNGLSPIVAHEIVHLAGLSSDTLILDLTTDALEALFKSFDEVMSRVRKGDFMPTLFLDEKRLPTEFYAFPLSLYKDAALKSYDSISEVLDYYYFEKSTRFNVGQKTADIKKLIHNFIERAVRKQHIQEKALEDAEHKDLYKIYGELLTAYSHQVAPKSDHFTTLNYYTEPYEDITIPLDPHKSAIQNAQIYFKLYNKAKRTEIAATEQLLIIEEDLKYLQSVLLSLDFLETKEDIVGLRSELIDMGYLKKRKGISPKKGNKKTLPYLHFKTTSGHDVYVGKNNYQNDELTMKFASSNDMWLHIKDGPGSHVIIKSIQGETFLEETLLEAAQLAAFYSSGKHSSKVPIDYTLKKNVKKVPNSKPGMVIYTQFKTFYITPDESFIKTLQIPQ